MKTWWLQNTGSNIQIFQIFGASFFKFLSLYSFSVACYKHGCFTFAAFQAFVFSIFFLFWSPVWYFLFSIKISYKKNQIAWFKFQHSCFHSLNWIFLQNNSAMWDVKCGWSFFLIQAGKNGTHPVFQKLYHPCIWTWSLSAFPILHSETSWIIQNVLQKQCKTSLMSISNS